MQQNPILFGTTFHFAHNLNAAGEGQSLIEPTQACAERGGGFPEGDVDAATRRGMCSRQVKPEMSAATQNLCLVLPRITNIINQAKYQCYT